MCFPVSQIGLHIRSTKNFKKKKTIVPRFTLQSNKVKILKSKAQLSLSGSGVEFRPIKQEIPSQCTYPDSGLLDPQQGMCRR